MARTIEGEHLEAEISHRHLRCAGERDGANGHATGNGRRMSNSTPTGGTCPREVLAHFLLVQIAASASRRLSAGSETSCWNKLKSGEVLFLKNIVFRGVSDGNFQQPRNRDPCGCCRGVYASGRKRRARVSSGLCGACLPGKMRRDRGA